MGNLNFKEVRPSDIDNCVCTLKKNNILKVTHINDNISFLIHEKDETNNVDEKLYIHVSLNNNAVGYIGRECAPEHVVHYKRTDLMYIFVCEHVGKGVIFVYDIKRSLDGFDIIVKLVEQISDTYKFAKNLLSYQDNVSLYESNLGVITESFDVDTVKRHCQSRINEIQKAENESLGFLHYKLAAQNYAVKRQLSIVESFLKGKIIIGGDEFVVNVCYMTDSEYHIYFEDGAIKEAQFSHDAAHN